MEAVGGILVLVSIVTGLVSFIALFKPLPRIYLPTRRRAAVVWAASFVLLLGGGALLPDAGSAPNKPGSPRARKGPAPAAEEFPTRQEDVERRLSELEELVNDEAWVRAKNDGDALQRELLPLFRSSIADAPEVTSIRTRLDDPLAVARTEENVLRQLEGRRQQEAARSTWHVSTRSNALDDSTMYMAILDASTGVGGLLDNEKVRLFAENGMSSGTIVDGMPEFPDKVVEPAWAQKGSGFYLSSEQGASFASGLDFSGTSNDRESACDEFLNPWYLLGGDRCTKVNRGEGDDWKNVFDGARGIVSGVALGYRLESRFRLELEYFFYNSEYDQTTPVTGADGVSFAKLGQEIERAEDRLGNLSSHNLFGNLYFDFINSSRFTPYVGVGAGVGFAAVDWGSIWARNADLGKITTGADFPFASNTQLVAFRQNLAGTVSSAQSEISDTLFGYQVLLGADYALTERVSLGVKGRWVNYSSLSDDVVWDPLRSHEPNLRRDGSEPVKGWMTSRNVAMVDFSFNLKYAF